MSLWSRLERRLGAIAEDYLSDIGREELVAARNALEADDPELAIGIIEPVVEQYPRHSLAQALLGAARLAHGNAEGALAAFDAAAALRDAHGEAEVGRGEALFALGRIDEARDAFRAGVDGAGGERPILGAAYRGIGRCFLETGDTERAVRELRKAVAEAPDDPDALVYLALALERSPTYSLDEARRYLSRALGRPGAPLIAQLAVGRVDVRRGDDDGAAAAFDAVLSSDRASSVERAGAWSGLAEVALSRGELDKAGDAADTALELSPGTPELLLVRGRIFERAGEWPAALQAYAEAAEVGDLAEARAGALRAALAVGDVGDRAVFLANRSLDVDANDSLALVVRGRALAGQGQTDAARATFRSVLDRGDDLEARLALGALELSADKPATAAQHGLAALHAAPRDQRARDLLVDARAAQQQTPTPLDDESAMYALARELEAVALSDPSLADLVPEVAQAAADFDQPLLVTVMGEFSSGKSTFINALVGDDIAPVGVTPTTATINVVKFGREPGGRILYRDGRTESLSWKALGAVLGGLSDDDARAVRSVEILYPLAELERVNIVDTPGLNSILPEHEAVARDFIKRADAVVWLFTAQQAGKKSERDALATINGEGKRALGVLNKVDQLSEADLSQLLDYVRGELGPLVEDIVPLSAQRARKHSAADPGAPGADTGSDGQPEAVTQRPDGNWPVVTRSLEQRFFSRARELKRQACDRRLAELLRRARDVIERRRENASGAADRLEHTAQTLREARAPFERLVVAQREELRTRMADVYRTAAREVLELVRPRKLPFGSHQASRADRDYLISLLESGLGTALEPAAAELERQLRELGETAARAVDDEDIGGDPGAELRRVVDEWGRWMTARVLERAQAYGQGYLRGGAVDRFFRDALPKLDLREDAVFHALFRDAPDVDGQIAEPLSAAARAALDALADYVDRLAAAADARAFDTEVGLLVRLRQIDDRREALSAPRDTHAS